MRNTDRHLTIGLLLGFVFALPAARAANQPAAQPPPVQGERDLGFFGNTRVEMLRNVTRVGLVPPWLPAEMRDREDVQQAVQDAVAKYLRLAGMEVVGPDTYKAASKRFGETMGGLFDVKTGIPRENVASIVHRHARREFVYKDRLDGYVITRVQKRPVKYEGFDASWDGVRERVDGRSSPGGLLRAFKSSDYSGTIMGLSISVQIANAQDRMVFGRMGGVQLAMYFYPTSDTGYSFFRVASEDLLRDQPRIDRAVNVATLPLRLSPAQIAAGYQDPEINAELVDLGKLPPLPGAKPRPRHVSGLLVPRAEILRRVHRVVVSPIRTDAFKMPEDMQARLRAEVMRALEPMGWELVDAPAAHKILREQFAAKDLFDPMTGKRDEEGASEIRKAAFPSIGGGAPPDAILWLSLVNVGAFHEQGDVEWNGVNQNGFTLGPVVKARGGRSARAGTGTGSIRAVSLNAYLADASDTPLYSSLGGLQLGQRLKYTDHGPTRPPDADPVDLEPDEMFHDPGRVAPAVHAALRELVMQPKDFEREMAREKR